MLLGLVKFSCPFVVGGRPLMMACRHPGSAPMSFTCSLLRFRVLVYTAAAIPWAISRIHSVCSAVPYFTMLSLRNLQGGQVDDTATYRPTRDPLLQTALRRPLNKLMT